ncbi:MAG: hypothetical protein RL205_1689 [Actinomycetota bacterium]|jgi:hypothetical protein
MARSGSISTSLSNGDALTPIAIGTVAWALAAVALLLVRDSLETAGTTWWFGACAVGIISGLGGIAYVLYRRRREGGAAR